MILPVRAADGQLSLAEILDQLVQIDASRQVTPLTCTAEGAKSAAAKGEVVCEEVVCVGAEQGDLSGREATHQGRREQYDIRWMNRTGPDRISEIGSGTARCVWLGRLTDIPTGTVGPIGAAARPLPLEERRVTAR